MKLVEFDYDLPEELIAQRPLDDRSASRLLWLHRRDGLIEHRSFRDVTTILQEGDLLVLNDTRVTARRLLGHRKSGGKVEALVLREVGEFHEALTRPAKKLRPGEELEFQYGLKATVLEDCGAGLKRLKFDHEGDLASALLAAGSVPLPPYVRRLLVDEERYQTVYSSAPGSAAAPTAGLHFTTDILATLESKGVQTARVSLDVGLDTFRPVAVEEIGHHVIHGERCTVHVETAEAVQRCKGRIVAVGTTTVRTLETFATGPREIGTGSQVSRLFITPGFQFKVVDGMFTNFHLPRTTMLFMVSAIAGRDRLMAAYDEAVRTKYRFLSFGDSMLVL